MLSPLDTWLFISYSPLSSVFLLHLRVAHFSRVIDKDAVNEQGNYQETKENNKDDGNNVPGIW